MYLIFFLEINFPREVNIPFSLGTEILSWATWSSSLEFHQCLLSRRRKLRKSVCCWLPGLGRDVQPACNKVAGLPGSDGSPCSCRLCYCRLLLVVGDVGFLWFIAYLIVLLHYHITVIVIIIAIIIIITTTNNNNNNNNNTSSSSSLLWFSVILSFVLKPRWQ